MAQIGLTVAIALVGCCCGAAALGAVLPDSDTNLTQAVAAKQKGGRI
jgi:hypothetical protein